MAKWLMAVASLALAAPAMAQTAAPQTAEEIAKLQEAGAHVLFWNQEQRDANFPAMEKLFPANVVKAGPNVRALPVGAPLPVSEAEVAAFVAAQNVAGLIVLQDGKIRLEHYARGFSQAGRWTSFSVAKSFTSTLVGAAIEDGHIKSVDEPVTKYIPELAGSGYDDVTIAQLLTMTSGVKWNESYTDPNSDVARFMMVQPKPGEDPTVAYMRTLPRESPPGEKWVYKTGETNLVGVLVRRATGKKLADYLSEKVWKPYGMEQDAIWQTDTSGSEVGGCCMSIALRDYARMGQLALEGGKGIVPGNWFDEATRAHAEVREGGFGYGYQWWTYPGGAYGASGIFGQTILVHPASRTVIAVVSAWPLATETGLWNQRMAFLTRLVSAASE